MTRSCGSCAALLRPRLREATQAGRVARQDGQPDRVSPLVIEDLFDDALLAKLDFADEPSTIKMTSPPTRDTFESCAEFLLHLA